MKTPKHKWRLSAHHPYCPGSDGRPGSGNAAKRKESGLERDSVFSYNVRLSFLTTKVGLKESYPFALD